MERTDAARLERQRFVVSRKATATVQNPQQEGHGQRRLQKGRENESEEFRDLAGRRAAADDELDEPDDTAGKEYEGEREESDQEWRDDLTGYVGAQGPMHTGNGSFL